MSFLTTLCYETYCLEKAYLVLLTIPIFFLLLFIIYKSFVKFRTKQEKENFREDNKFLRLYVLITRTFMVFFILVAIAAPFTTKETVTHGSEVIKLLVDNSDSMSIFDEDLIDQVKEKLKGEVVEISQVAAGKRSELGENILKKIQGKDNLLLLTDGNNNFGKQLVDLGIYSRVSDTRLFALNIEEKRNDALVEIIGPSETIEGTPNRFKVKVDFVGNQPAFTLQIYIDDVLEFSGKNIFEKDILKTFGKGYHKITAKILLKDFIEENNVFYKAVKAVPKPKIAFVSSTKSSMEDGLKQIYDFKKFSSLPTNLNSYSAIVLNDVSYSKLKSRIDDLTGYLLDGNGLFFIGGRHSFDKGGYKGTLLEGMLPVTVGTGKIISPLKNNIVIVLDVSESFGDSKYFRYSSSASFKTQDLSKGLVVDMLNNFRDDIRVGLVVFAGRAQKIEDIIQLKDNRESMISKVKRLGSSEGSNIVVGLDFAERMLQNVVGTKNIILVTDGKEGWTGTKKGVKDHTLRLVDNLVTEGIKIYTVGMPSYAIQTSGQDSDEGTLDKEGLYAIAKKTGGQFFAPGRYESINFFFGKPETKDKVFSGQSNLAIIDDNHFITQDLDLNARITGVNFVLPKLGTRSLIFTGDGNPVLNTWNFGLGRVITLATDDGKEWAASLLKQDNSILLTRIINYAVGNPEKNKELYIDVKDSYLGEPTEIMVRSEKYPVSKELTFVKEGEQLYKAEFSADKEGYYQFFDAIVAVNPYREYYNLGLNPDLKDMVEISGGKVLDLDDKDIKEEIRTYTERIELKRQDLKMFPLGAALLIFIIEIIIRKIYEHKKFKI
jgi:hypothetical protein